MPVEYGTNLRDHYQSKMPYKLDMKLNAERAINILKDYLAAKGCPWKEADIPKASLIVYSYDMDHLERLIVMILNAAVICEDRKELALMMSNLNPDVKAALRESLLQLARKAISEPKTSYAMKEAFKLLIQSEGVAQHCVTPLEKSSIASGSSDFSSSMSNYEMLCERNVFLEQRVAQLEDQIRCIDAKYQQDYKHRFVELENIMACLERSHLRTVQEMEKMRDEQLINKRRLNEQSLKIEFYRCETACKAFARKDEFI